MIRAIVASCLALALGCSGGTSVDGTVAGKGLDPKETVAGLHSGGGNEVLELWIGNQDRLCAHLNQQTTLNYMDGLGFQLAIIDADTGVAKAPRGPGTFQIVTEWVRGQVASAVFVSLDCRLRISDQATSGTVTLESVEWDGSRFAGASGTFDLHFADGHLTGKFSADPCGGISPVYANSICAP